MTYDTSLPGGVTPKLSAMRAAARRKQRAIAALVHPAAGDLDGVEDRAENPVAAHAPEIVVAVVAHPVAQLGRTTEHRREVLVAVREPDVQELRFGDRVTDVEARVVGLGGELRERRGEPLALDVRGAERTRNAVHREIRIGVRDAEHLAIPTAVDLHRQPVAGPEQIAVDEIALQHDRLPLRITDAAADLSTRAPLPPSPRRPRDPRFRPRAGFPFPPSRYTAAAAAAPPSA